ncbi:MAG: hypothetical protein M1817_001312 [Caeruleum heppii]|nr:MAG: hypothetical protein M1817_001312 [Caeruleum heppii]
MPSYAILGATGATGSCLFRTLEGRPSTNLNLYVRSRRKLETLFPSISEHKHVHIFEGWNDDVPLLTQCIRHTDVVFQCVAVNDNQPGLRLAEQMARNVVSALKALRADDPSAKLPSVIVLSAAPANPVLAAALSFPVRSLVHRAFSHIYADLERAETFLRAEADWVHAVFVQPGGLSEAEPRGYGLSETTASPNLAYLDLARGMVQIAEEGERWYGKGVAVVADEKAGGPQPGLEVLGQVVVGLLGHFLPTVWLWLKGLGWI